jgi:hypothetical protein
VLLAIATAVLLTAQNVKLDTGTVSGTAALEPGVRVYKRIPFAATRTAERMFWRNRNSSDFNAEIEAHLHLKEDRLRG